jgi:paraquat-inducible protein A
MSALIACHGCDLLVDVEEVRQFGQANCPRCGHLLTRFLKDGFVRVLAYAVAGAVFLTVANLFSFLTLEAGGLASTMTLPQTALALFSYGMPFLSLLVAVFIILLPALILGLLVAICAPLIWQKPVPWLHSVAHLFFTFYNWAMVEVFIIGVVVSLIKLSSLADVDLGISFWAYVGFSLCFTGALASLDRYHTWESIEALEQP